MKLLTTIAAVLISISAFSQDLIEYNESTYSLNGEEVSLEYKSYITSFNPNAKSMFDLSLGTFTQNGEQLSMEQINNLTLSYNTGIGDFSRGNRFERLHKNGNLRSNNNGLNALGGLASGAAGGFLGMAAAAAFSFYEISAMHFIVTAAAGGLCVVSYKAFSRIASSPEECLRKRDKQFNKVAEKINQAIKAANP